tara:strand:- start:38 stop:271 length:234 start_codon:yes stop_codon:yes gene_type:complete
VCLLSYDSESVVHRALLISGIITLDDSEPKAMVFKSNRNGEQFDTKQQFAEQRKAYVWGIPGSVLKVRKAGILLIDQ